MIDFEQKIYEQMRDAEAKAWEALSGYKFWMFGYHAARWVQCNNLLPEKFPNPFREAVALGRRKIDTLAGQQSFFGKEDQEGDRDLPGLREKRV